jgi:hypothetical protein
MENIKRPFEISQRIFQAHCQSPRSQRYNQSFVKELAKPTLNRLTTKTEEEHRTDNSTYKKLAVQWLNEVHFFNQTFVQVDSFVLRNRHLLIAAPRCVSCRKNHRTNSTFAIRTSQLTNPKLQKSYFLPRSIDN